MGVQKRRGKRQRQRIRRMTGTDHTGRGVGSERSGKGQLRRH